MQSEVACPACTAPWSGERARVGPAEVLACATCGLWFSPETDVAAVDYSALYASPEYRAAQVEPLARTRDWRTFARYPTYRPFFEQVQRRAGESLLDVGCGVGIFCRAAHAAGWNVRGIDVAAAAVEQGRGSAPFPLECATAAALGERGERFDVVTAFEVLEHQSHPVPLVQDLFALLAPGGSLFCTVPNRESRLVQNASRPDWLPPVHLLFFTATALRQLLERVGFTVVASGVIDLEAPPSLLRPGRLKYELRRLRQRHLRPDPAGLWAHGRRP